MKGAREKERRSASQAWTPGLVKDSRAGEDLHPTVV